jgi:hypothetical protein
MMRRGNDVLRFNSSAILAHKKAMFLELLSDELLPTSLNLEATFADESVEEGPSMQGIS